jgi:heptose I phosphotransferase
MAPLVHQLKLDPELARHFGTGDPFTRVLALEGEIFRNLNGRKTLRFVVDGKGYFAKIHLGVGWMEILKNLLHFKIPVLSAENEWRAIERLEQLGIRSMHVAGHGLRAGSPARRQSFLITEELANTISLELLCRAWPLQPPPFELRLALIKQLAWVARQMHQHGINHRDFYLGHFLLRRTSLQPPYSPQGLELFLIDLHRAQIRQRTPQRWILKDVAGLFFSAMDVGLTRRDIFRFMKIYADKPLRQTIDQDKRFWRAVLRQGLALYAKVRKRAPNPAFAKLYSGTFGKIRCSSKL